MIYYSRGVKIQCIYNGIIKVVFFVIKMIIGVYAREMARNQDDELASFISGFLGYINRINLAIFVLLIDKASSTYQKMR